MPPRWSCPASRYFYPRSPCGERRPDPVYHGRIYWISIHALLAESDCSGVASVAAMAYFYPRSPCGERPLRRAAKPVCRAISIHALLAESDVRWCAHALHKMYFYPRSPCGERRRTVAPVTATNRFLSTLSLRRATEPAFFLGCEDVISIHALLAESDPACPPPTFHAVISIHALLAESDHVVNVCRRAVLISIHALLAESDGRQYRWPLSCSYFYPRSPCGERPSWKRLNSTFAYFYPRSPCGERRLPCVILFNGKVYFYPRSPCGERQAMPSVRHISKTNFYPRSPCGERRELV